MKGFIYVLAALAALVVLVALTYSLVVLFKAWRTRRREVKAMRALANARWEVVSELDAGAWVIALERVAHLPTGKESLDREVVEVVPLGDTIARQVAMNDAGIYAKVLNGEWT